MYKSVTATLVIHFDVKENVSELTITRQIEESTFDLLANLESEIIVPTLDPVKVIGIE